MLIEEAEAGLHGSKATLQHQLNCKAAASGLVSAGIISFTLPQDYAGFIVRSIEQSKVSDLLQG